MKRCVRMLMIIFACIFVLSSVTAYAATYNVSGTDISISIDDTSWYVFTRENIKNNSELDALGISYDDMYKILYDNNAYMDAFVVYEDGDFIEFFIRKNTVDSSGPANLSNYGDDFVLDVANGLAERQGTNNYSVYKTQYKFAKLEYIDSNYNYYIYEFYTIVNKEAYTFTFQATSALTAGERKEIEEIVNSIRFDVDPTIKEQKTSSIGEKVIVNALSGAMLGGVVGLGSLLFRKKKKKAEKEAEEKVGLKVEEYTKHEAEACAKREMKELVEHEVDVQPAQTKLKAVPEEKTLAEKLSYALLYQTDDGLISYLRGIEDERVVNILKEPNHLIRGLVEKTLEEL